jgi:sugar phosphate isomerase/epimerase
MRLGGPVFGDVSTPEKWIATVRRHDYQAAYCPVKADAGEAAISAYAQAAKEADIVIAEVGAWSNPISLDESVRQKAIQHNIAQLTLAEQIGARCCVNIAGSRNPDQWDGPHRDNLTNETFDLIVQTVQLIIDAVQPKHTFYTLETMPWAFPDSTDSYVRLIKAIDRPAFAAHLDPANLVNCPERFLNSTAFLKDCFARLGPHTKGCHLKDITLSGKMTVHLDEVAPGKGGLDYHTLLTELDRLDPDTPAMLEHLSREEEYADAAHYVRKIAAELGITL